MKTPSPSRPLKIYKASAGSGKTFTLAVEYIKLLIIDPLEYKNTLAVTFTNKATAEMKIRILSQLYGLSKGLTSSQDYLDKIKKEPKIAELDDDLIRQRATMALQNIVHDYSRFRIETIDSFFQSVLRDLAHELKLSANLRVDLNDKEVLQKAVEKIIYDLVPTSPLFKWIFYFVKQKIDEEKNWVVKDSIAKFGENIFNETFLEDRAKVDQTLKDPKALPDYRDKMNKIYNDAKKAIQDDGLRFMEICEQNHLTESDFNGKSKSVYPFMKAMSLGQEKNWTSTVQNTLDGTKEWMQKGVTAPCNEFHDLLEDISKQIIIRNSADVSRKHITNLGLLTDIDRIVRLLNDDANRFLLSETSHFLNKMIGESDVPFIYEKIGNRFNHIMIDEFQDTSRLQWRNFLPLLCNALSTDSTCLIVGDVKQSIYRWRNSDWSILNNIEKEGAIKNKVESIPLSTNFRSGERIIHFNNLFFVKLIEILNKNYETNHNGDPFSDLKNAYNDIHQDFNAKNAGKGYVRFTTIPSDDYDENTLRSLLNTVQELKNKGVKERQIAIILRVNKHIPKICKYFAENDNSINIMSDEAFQLKSSPAVKIIINAMRTLVNPKDSLSKKSLAVFYTQIDSPNNDVYTASDEQLDNYLPKAFVRNKTQLSMMSLTELTEQIYLTFGLERIKGQSAYLFCLYDKIIEYINDNPSDINSFLTAWDAEKGIAEKTIPNDSVEGIRILSIHKSKGLEYHTVLMPFCDWKIKGEEILWVEPKEKNFNDIQLLPIDNSQKLIKTFYKKDYDDELLRTWVDHTNMLYVGFTRAVNNLMIWTTRPKEDKKEKEGVTIPNIINNCMTPGLSNNETASGKLAVTLKNNVGVFEETEVDDVASLFTRNDVLDCMEYGELVSNEEKVNQKADEGEKEEVNILNVTPTPIKSHFIFNQNEACFLQSNESKRFLAGEDDERDDHYINEGKLFHAILERITTPDDLDRLIRQFEADGAFSSKEYRNSVANELKKAFLNTKVSEWFDPKWRAFNECSILYTDEKGKCQTRRPDRVIANDEETIVIDYKTGQQSTDHVDQVLAYMDLLGQMGFPNIKGYVWYVRRNDIVPCRKD